MPKVYAVIEESCLTGDGEPAGDFVLFDGIDSKSLSVSPENPFSQSADWVPRTWQLTVPTSVLTPDILRDVNRGPVEIEFQPGNNGQISGYIFPLRYNTKRTAPLPAGISRISPIENTAAVDKYEKLVSLEGVADADPREIEKILNSVLSPLIRPMVVVYDVGQANWNSVTDASCCVATSPCAPSPLLYFDFGLPIPSNRKTLPIKPLPLASVSTNAPVVLSHWDMDHYAGAAASSGTTLSKWLPFALDRPWIVPRQNKALSGRNISASALSLALALHRSGKLFVFPTTSGPLVLAHDSYVVQCRPPSGKHLSLNSTGLIMALNVGPKDYVNKYVLLPGDAEYGDIDPHIPGHLKAFSWCGIVGSHHGGSLVSKTCPTACLHWHKVVFSNGHKYGHTTASAKLLHSTNGWKYQPETASRRTRVIGSVKQVIGSTSLGIHFPAASAKGTCAACSYAAECCPIK